MTQYNSGGKGDWEEEKGWTRNGRNDWPKMLGKKRKVRQGYSDEIKRGEEDWHVVIKKGRKKKCKAEKILSKGEPRRTKIISLNETGRKREMGGGAGGDTM